MTAAPIGTAYEARLAHRGLARAAVTVEDLEAQGYEAGEADPRYGSVWCLRPVEPATEEASRG